MTLNADKVHLKNKKIGTYFYNDMSEYKGTWSNDKRNGKG